MEHEARITARHVWVLALASVGAFMISLDSQVVAAALTTIRRDLGASIETLQWTVNAYNLSFAVLLLTVVGMVWLALVASPGLPYPELLPPLIVGGCGVSFAIPAAQRAALGAVEMGEVGKASGAVGSLRRLGAVFGVAILTTVFAVTGSFASASSFTAGFAPAMGAAAGLALIGAVAGLGIPGMPRRIVR